MIECCMCRRVFADTDNVIMWTIVTPSKIENQVCNACELDYRQRRAKSTQDNQAEHAHSMLPGIHTVSPSRVKTAKPGSVRDSAEGDLFSSEAEAS